MEDSQKQIQELFLKSIENKTTFEKVEFINSIRAFIHQFSPFKDEPVDFVKWVVSNKIIANDYNPNKVAPPEMELLEISILNDGYTQPIVTWPHDDKVEVIDGFHRSRVGKESKLVKSRIKGFLPTVIIKKDKQGKKERIASTIRHNRARGKHQINAMSEIVLELKNRNWTNSRIARELGMDEEEILRLCQISGLEDIFKDDDFSKSWTVGDSIHEYEQLTDQLKEDEITGYRTTNTSDPDRVFHTYEKWECYKAGFFATKKDGMTKNECEKAYADFLSNSDKFKEALNIVITTWKYSCEHYLTNIAMNRIAWLGQASMCYATGVPSKFCSGFNLLTPKQQEIANIIALEYLNKWMLANDRNQLTIEQALSIGRQVNIY
jgi:ParB-like chromosome segregation protein Spo0J